MSSISNYVDYQPISIIPLSNDGYLPTDVSSLEKPPSFEHYKFTYLPPKNLTEKILMSMWINCHQAMFISTSIAASCIRLIIKKLASPERCINEIGELISTAISCRLSSAVYTSLPFLNQKLYEQYVRLSMQEVHRGFSGVSNRESIAMEESLRNLKVAHLSLLKEDRLFAEAVNTDLKRLYEADKSWWRFHGKAMRKYVTDPLSLARIDYFTQKQSGSNDSKFKDYRERELRNEKALNNYDLYFGIDRSTKLGTEDYYALLDITLNRTEFYIDQSGDLADFRSEGVSVLHKAIQLIKVNTEMLSTK